LFRNSIEPTDTKRSIDDIPLRNARVAEEEAADQPNARQSAPARKQADPLVDVVADKHNLYTTDKKFPTAARVYYSDYQQKQEVMRAQTNTITTKLDDRQTIGQMLDLAQARGWQTVKLRGTDAFEREAWVQAQARGMKAEGYKPTNTDKQEVERRWASAMDREERAAANPVAAATSAAAADRLEAARAKPSERKQEKTAVAPTQAAGLGPRDLVLGGAVNAAAADRLAAAKAKPLSAVKAGGEDDWRKEQEKAGPAAAPAPAAAPSQSDQEKAVWTAKEAVGKAAREADQPVQKPTEKAAEKPAVMAA